MAYAEGRVYYDADSHLMELPDFLSAHAGPGLAGRLPDLVERGNRIDGVDVGGFDGAAGHAPEVVGALMELGDSLLKGPKWHGALGAFNGAERAKALDLLGFERQVVFSSLCASPVFDEPDLDIVYGACEAHNRSMADFCSADSRLCGVGLLALDEPKRALEEIARARDLGLGALWIPAKAPGGRSPGHPDHDPVWAELADSGIPFVLHVGSGPLQIPPEWMNDGHPEQTSARGGAEVIGSKDFTVIYQPAERFISVLVLDGVLDRFPNLRGGVIEMGAGWVPEMIRRLDDAAQIWSRTETHLARMSRKPSEQIRDQLRFTPYPFEDVGRLIRESAPELYMFSTDYPHAEGGRDPLGRFERSLEGFDEATKQRFFAGNFADLFSA